MLVIVADSRDADATALVERWRGHDAWLMTSSDLSAPGWCHRVASPGASTAVIGGRMVDTETITGVLSLLPCVTAGELVRIVPEDRAYVATEMTAFLLSWLSSLTCPMLNRPTPDCLTGPNWRPAQWVHAAAKAGIPVRPAGPRTETTAPAATVTVVGEICTGSMDAVLRRHARKLAAATGVPMLAVHFEGAGAGARILGADPRPDIASPEIADAILRCLGGGSGC